MASEFLVREDFKYKNWTLHSSSLVDTNFEQVGSAGLNRIHIWMSFNFHLLWTPFEITISVEHAYETEGFVGSALGILSPYTCKHIGTFLLWFRRRPTSEYEQNKERVKENWMAHI